MCTLALKPFQFVVSLSNKTEALTSRLEPGTQSGDDEDTYSHGKFSPSRSGVSYSEFELLQHQKEELEMQNRRLVERISKLKYILKGISPSCQRCLGFSSLSSDSTVFPGRDGGLGRHKGLKLHSKL